MSSPVVWFEIMNSGSSSVSEFYADTFGWTFNRAPGPEYYLANTGSERGVPGGIGEPPAPGAQWVTFYIEVPSINETLASIEAKGGSIVQPRTQASDTLIVGMFKDPSGNIIGLVEASPPA